MKNKLLFGVGINDLEYATRSIINGKQIRCKFYEKWRNMLCRCYYGKYHERQPTYIGCSVCPEWLYFSNFKAWMERQDWEGKQLDKDLIVQGNKIYSPDTCVFISRRVNSFLSENNARRGEYPIGAHFNQLENKFKSQANSVITGKRKGLGTYNTAEEAHKAWLVFKLEQAYILASEQTDERVAKALIDRYKNYMETK